MASPWCLNPSPSAAVNASPGSLGHPAKALYNSQHGPHPSVIAGHDLNKLNAQGGHFAAQNSIWRESQNTTYSVENASYQTQQKFVESHVVRHQPAAYAAPRFSSGGGREGGEGGHGGNWYQPPSEGSAGMGSTWRVGASGKKSFADLFQSVPGSRQDLGSRTECRGKGFEGGGGTKRVGEAAAMADADRLELLLRETNSRIQAATRLFCDAQADFTGKIEELRKAMDNSFAEVRLSLGGNAKRRHNLLAPEGAQAEPNGSLWSQEPESYVTARLEGAGGGGEGRQEGEGEAAGGAMVAAGGAALCKDTISITTEDAIEDDSSEAESGDEDTLYSNYIKKRVSLFFKTNAAGEGAEEEEEGGE